MNILIAPDKFKGSLTALQICQAIKKGIHKHAPNIDITFHPLADGGDGSIEVLSKHLALKAVDIKVLDPLGRPISAQYFVDRKIAFIELAVASGYVLLDEGEKNPRLTSTYGTGQMLADALQKGYKEVYLFLGGSATNDAGIGLAAALGYVFLDKNKKELAPIGENLGKIAQIDKSKVAFDFSKIKITALCDVANTLYGPNGAAYVYAPQKGASKEDVLFLDTGLRNVAHCVQKSLGIDLQAIKGGGAAGGIAAGLVAFCQANLVSGTETIMQLTNFEEKMRQCDWVISGEGRLDKQTLEGKVIQGVLKIAKKHKKKAALFVGSSLLSKQELSGVDTMAIHSILDIAPTVKSAMEEGDYYLAQLAEAFCKKHLQI